MGRGRGRLTTQKPRLTDLGEDYRAAWEEWESGGDHEAWDAAVGDGLADPER